MAAILHYRSLEAAEREKKLQLVVSMRDAIDQTARRFLPPSDELNIKHTKGLMGRYLGLRSAAARREQQKQQAKVCWLDTEPNYLKNEVDRRRIDEVDRVRLWILERTPGARDAFFIAVAIVGGRYGASNKTKLQSWFGKGLSQKKHAEAPAPVPAPTPVPLPRVAALATRTVSRRTKRPRKVDPRQLALFPV